MKRHIALALLVCISSAAGAQTSILAPAAEALPGAGYPDPQCKKPQTNAVKPTGVDTTDPGEVGRYNLRIKEFNRDSAAYGSCMHAYIDKANDDVKVVQDKANADLKQITERANASMKAIQDKIRSAVAEASSVSAALEEQTAKLRKK